MIDFQIVLKAIGIIAVVLLIFLSYKSKDRQILKQLAFIRKKYAEDIIAEKYNVKCSSFVSGMKNYRLQFKKCDLIFLKNALVIISFRQVLSRKLYSNLFFIEQNIVLGVGPIKSFNANSFNGEVYIEFGESSFNSTNVCLHLKHLTDEEKKLIPLSR